MNWQQYFPGQGKKERVLYFGREHPWSFFLAIQANVFIAIVVIWLLFVPIVWAVLHYVYDISYSFIITAGVGCVITLLICILFVLYYRDTYYVVTNKRMIKHVRESLFNYHMKEIHLRNVDEIFYVSKGVWARIRNYGTVNAGTKTEMLIVYFRGVKHAKLLSSYLSKLRSFLHKHPDADPADIIPYNTSL